MRNADEQGYDASSDMYVTDEEMEYHLGHREALS